MALSHSEMDMGSAKGVTFAELAFQSVLVVSIGAQCRQLVTIAGLQPGVAM